MTKEINNLNRALQAETEAKRLREVLLNTFKTLIKANNTGLINDTIWCYNCDLCTLWEYIMSELNMSEEEYQELEREVNNGKEH